MSSKSHWSTCIQRVANGTRISVLQDSVPLSTHELLKLLARDARFREWYSALLASSSFDAYFWELPALSLRTVHDNAEFVLLHAPELAVRAQDQRPFAAKFAGNKDDIAVFASLGGDAQLIAPCPITDIDCYAHLAIFMRAAPASQKQRFWHVTATTALQLIGTETRWLSTSGMGVSWLHARLDQRPKYFQHQPYKASA